MAKAFKLFDEIPDQSREVIVTDITEIPKSEPQFSTYVLVVVKEGKVVDAFASSMKNYACHRRYDKLVKEFPAPHEVWHEKFFSKTKAIKRRDYLKENTKKTYDYGIKESF